MRINSNYVRSAGLVLLTICSVGSFGCVSDSNTRYTSTMTAAERADLIESARARWDENRRIRKLARELERAQHR